MAKLCVMPTGVTVWDEQDRVESAAGAPLAPRGAESVRAAAVELARRKIRGIYAGTGEAERQTAALLSDALGVKVRVMEELREIDYGLWQGLTSGQMKRRYAKLWRQWRESPASVRPTGGETLDDVRQRLRSGLRQIARRHKAGEALVVLRPVVLALARCLLEGGQVQALWQYAEASLTWRSYETDGGPP